jgi:NTE family protein
MATSSKPIRRGLVLGGGGVVGAAWITGALCALEQVHGFDATEVDVIIGTSAGSVIGALLASGVTPQQLRNHQLGEPVNHGVLDDFSWDHDTDTGGSRPPMPKLRGPGSPALMRNSLIAMGRRQSLPTTATIAAFMPIGTGSLDRVGDLMDVLAPTQTWANHSSYWAVSMDYESGKRVAFGREGAPVASLSEAVRASCAVPGWFAPVSIEGRRYVDGGATSATSVDLLEGYGLDEIYVLAPMVSLSLDRPSSLPVRLERRWRTLTTKRCLEEVERVRLAGSSVTVLGPGPNDLENMGANSMDLDKRLAVLESSLRNSASAFAAPGSRAGTYVAVPDSFITRTAG